MAEFLLLRRRRSWLGAHYQRISLKPFCGMKLPLGRIDGRRKALQIGCGGHGGTDSNPAGDCHPCPSLRPWRAILRSF
jgi:hypothetical protein